MRDFKLDLFLNFGGHLDLHGNARRDDTLKLTAESREESASAMRRYIRRSTTQARPGVTPRFLIVRPCVTEYVTTPVKLGLT
jgi:hypothetical protein